jgi:L-ascorbate metabolism protein UlaG (beta-lactamase superfamily)
VDPAGARAAGDLIFVPVGGGPTIGAAQAAEIVARLRPSFVVPMHYRTERVNFLEPADAFLELIGGGRLLDQSSFELGADERPAAPQVVVPRAP